MMLYLIVVRTSRNMKNSVYDIFEEVSETIFPNFKKVIFLYRPKANIQLLTLPLLYFIDLCARVCFVQTVWLECTQDQNEIIFVPSGWYHQVHNLVRHLKLLNLLYSYLTFFVVCHM